MGKILHHSLTIDGVRTDKNNIENLRDTNMMNSTHRTNKKSNKAQVSVDLSEKFDKHVASESLQTYMHKLLCEKNGKKQRQNLAARRRLGRTRASSASSVERYEDLYEMGKAKIMLDKERSISKASDNVTHGLKADQIPLSQRKICSRLYDQSARMQQNGKKRRQEIGSKSVPRPQRSSVRMHSIEVKSRPSNNVLDSHVRSFPPWQEVMHRLYKPSQTKQEYGKIRRESIRTRTVLY